MKTVDHKQHQELEPSRKSRIQCRSWPLLLSTVGLFMSPVLAGSFILDFDTGIGGTPVEGTYSGTYGITFDGAQFATSGIELNEADFPPYSGLTVITPDAGGVIRATMSDPAYAVGSFFTYSLNFPAKLTLTAYASPDLTGDPIGVVNSGFSKNFVGNGNPLAKPNEFLGIFVGTPSIQSFKIESTSVDGGYTMDRLIVFNAAAVPEPLPTCAGLLLCAFAVLKRYQKFA